ncbi:MAG: hypothetical protein R3F08_09440 [Dokdonella sp.]
MSRPARSPIPGTGDSNETPPDGDTLITPVVGSPALNTAKALTSNADGDASGTDPGDVLTHTVTVTNTGNESRHQRGCDR